MSKKSLKETNPYLKDPKKFREALIRSVSTSTAIETSLSAKTLAGFLTESQSKTKRKKTKAKNRKD